MAGTGGLAGFFGGPAGAAVGIGSSLLGGWLASRKSPTQKLLEQTQLQSLQDSTGRAKSFWDLAGTSAGQVRSYLSPLLGGNRTAMTSALSPEIQGITERDRMAQQAAMTTTNRSGAAQTMFDPLATSKQISNLMLQARPQAAQNMTNLAQMYGSWGQANTGASADAARNLGTLEENKWQKSKDLGSSVFNLIKSLLPQLMGSGKAKGGSGGLIGVGTVKPQSVQTPFNIMSVGR